MTGTDPDAPLEPDEWLAAFARLLDVDPPDATTVETLLALAGSAAHASARTAAPIACYLVGRAGLDVTEALARAEQVPGSISGR